MQAKPGAIYFLMMPGILVVIGIAIWLVISYIKNKSDNTLENRNAIIGTILFVIGGVPLIIYPGILIASAMAFDSPPSRISIDLIMILLLLVLALSYPITYVLALIFYKKRKKLLYACLPLIHLVIAILPFAIGNVMPIH